MPKRWKQRRSEARLRPLLFTLVAMLLLVTMPVAPPAASAQDDLVPRQMRVRLTGGMRTVTLWVARGLDLGIAATGLPSARMLAQSPTGELVVSQVFEGTVSKLSDHDGDGTYEDHVPILENLNAPHGLALVGNALYIAASDQILRLDPWWNPSTAQQISELPGGGMHVTRTLALGPDGLLYVSIGSSCDACVESDRRRATVLRLNPAGGPLEPVAHGIRNAVGMTWNPSDGQLWVTENGQNALGDEIPPDEVNVVRVGADYGWPDCYGDRLPVSSDVPPDRCTATEPPVLQLPAHSAPLGLTFFDSALAPADMRGDLLIALHGSAERSDPVGYELARVPMRDGVPQEAITLVRGWLVNDDSWGRPVAPFVASDGTLYLTDDKGGVIYWLRAAAASD